MGPVIFCSSLPGIKMLGCKLYSPELGTQAAPR